MDHGSPAIEVQGTTGLCPPIRAPQAAPPVPHSWWRNALIGAVALAGALGALVMVWLLAYPLLLLFAAIVVAEALAPIVEWLDRWLPRALAVVLVYLLLAVVVVVLGSLVVPELVDQAAQLLAAAPGELARVRDRLDRLDPDTSGQIVAFIQDRLGRIGATVLTLPLTLASALITILFVFLMSAYWLIATPALHRFVLSLLPEQRRPGVADVLGEVGQTLGGYIRGQGLSCVIIGVGTYIGLTVIGVDFPLVLALLAGLANLIPMVGIYIATVPAVVVGLLHSPTQALVVLAFYVVFSNIESNIVEPNIQRRQANIPSLLVIFALFAGSTLGGILGALIAIPFAGALRVLVLRGAAPVLRRWTGAPEPEPAPD